MKRKFAAFDIDGTFYRGSLYLDVVEKLIERNLLDAGGVENHLHVKELWKSRNHSNTYNDYVDATVQTVLDSIEKISPTDIEEAARKVVEEKHDHVYTYTRDLISSLKKDGYFLIAISGSQHEVVSKFIDKYDFDAFASTEWFRTDDGQKYTGDAIVRGSKKEKYLKEFIEKYDLTIEGSIAVGDSAGDTTMLDFVENPIAFNPEDTLYETAKQKGWKIVVERKNVIYELEAGDGGYVLA